MADEHSIGAAAREAGFDAGRNAREMAILKELIEMVKVGACSSADADRASAFVCRDVGQFEHMGVCDAADLALELGRIN